MAKIKGLTINPKLVTIVEYKMWNTEGTDYFFDKTEEQIIDYLKHVCETVEILNKIHIEAKSVIINGKTL